MRNLRSIIVAIIWDGIALLLIGWGVSYFIIHSQREIYSAILDASILIVSMAVLFYSEGSDVVVSDFLDSDPEVLPDVFRATISRLQRTDPAVWSNGRQTIAVFAAIAMAVACAALSDIRELQDGKQSGIVLFIGDSRVRDTFCALFPALIALWFVQMPARLIASHRPLSVFNYSFTQFAIAMSLFAGEYVRAAGPGFALAGVLRVMAPMDAASPQIRRSRKTYYRDWAMLRDGKGLERVHIAITVYNDGSVHAHETYRYKAYLSLVHSFWQQVGWDAPIEDATLVVTESPAAVTVSGPRYFTDAMNFVEWSVDVPTRLAVGEILEYGTRYKTAAHATKSAIGELDYFQYDIRRTPTAELIFEIRPSPDADFTFADPEVKALTSEDDSVNIAEADRVAVLPYGRGIRYHVSYPLLGTRFKFYWTIRAARTPVKEAERGPGA